MKEIRKGGEGLLIEFSIKNFRSFEKEAILSLLATSDKLLPKNVIKTKTLKKEKLLKSAVLYGGNASGKTNVLLALNYLVKFVLFSHFNQKGDLLDYFPFKFNKKTITQPTEFIITFIKDDVKYIYSLSHNDKAILNESLYYYPKGRKATIFIRSNIDGFTFIKDKSRQRDISEKTPANVLYLSRATQFDYDLVSKAFDWFKDNLQVIGPTDHPYLKDFTFDLMQKSHDFKTKVLKALNYADIGIEDIKAKASREELDSMPKDFPMELQMKKSGTSIEKIFKETRSIIMYHNGIPLNYFQESEGTQRLFSLIGLWIDALENGRILIVDELDTKLHHLLNILLINLFHDPSQNKTNAQLVFSTHNLNLLDRKFFRRDQIWFTEKNPSTQSTELFSLVEYNPRNDKNYQNGYLAGRYGGLPYIKSYKVF